MTPHCALFRRDRIDIFFVLRVLLAQAASVEATQVDSAFCLLSLGHRGGQIKRFCFPRKASSLIKTSACAIRFYRCLYLVLITGTILA